MNDRNERQIDSACGSQLSIRLSIKRFTYIFWRFWMSVVHTRTTARPKFYVFSRGQASSSNTSLHTNFKCMENSYLNILHRMPIVSYYILRCILSSPTDPPSPLFVSPWTFFRVQFLVLCFVCWSSFFYKFFQFCSPLLSAFIWSQLGFMLMILCGGTTHTHTHHILVSICLTSSFHSFTECE